jgi:hypothetical protein
VEIRHPFSDLFRAEEEVNHVKQVKVLQIGIVAELATAVRHRVVTGWRAVQLEIGLRRQVPKYVQVDENEVEPMKQKLNLLLRCNESVVHDDVSLLLLFELEKSVHRLHLPQILE